ncbi:uncharacterized protein LOC144168145 [Haemaphysalis longicornis]
MTPVAEGDAFGHQVTADDATRRSRLFRKQGGASCTLRQTLGYVVSCGIAVTAVVAIVLVTIFHHDTGLETLSLCVSDECSVFAKHVSASLNRSVPPCNDFYEFVCGNWANANPGYVSEVSRASAALVAKAAYRLTDRHATYANDSIVYKAAALFSLETSLEGAAPRRTSTICAVADASITVPLPPPQITHETHTVVLVPNVEESPSSSDLTTMAE